MIECVFLGNYRMAPEQAKVMKTLEHNSSRIGRRRAVMEAALAAREDRRKA